MRVCVDPVKREPDGSHPAADTVRTAVRPGEKGAHGPCVAGRGRVAAFPKFPGGKKPISENGCLRFRRCKRRGGRCSPRDRYMLTIPARSGPGPPSWWRPRHGLQSGQASQAAQASRKQAPEINAYGTLFACGEGGLAAGRLDHSPTGGGWGMGSFRCESPSPAQRGV